MTFCVVSPRFFPVIGGVENYFKNILENWSYNDIYVITSDLKNIPKSIFEKSFYIKEKNLDFKEEIKIIRTKTLKNFGLKGIFYFNQYLNKKIEIFYDKIINPDLYQSFGFSMIKIRFNHNLKKYFLIQRLFTNPNFIQIYFSLKKIHQKKRIELIHSAPIYFTSNVCAFIFSKRYHIPYICSPFFHINPYADYIFYPSYQYILKKSNAIIVSTELEKRYYEKYDINKNNIYVIPPGIDPIKYQNSDTKYFKSRYNIPEDSPIIFIMGRRTNEKGFPQVIHSLFFLIKKFKNIKLIIAGPSTRDYKILFNYLPDKIKNHIIDLGIVDEKIKKNAFASCDIFVLPSLDDSFGLVYLEAWLFKKPVIGALEGNVAGLIDDDINGLLIPFKNVNKLTLALENLLKDKDKRYKLGQNGYKKLINNYLLERTNNMIINLYEKYI